MEKLSEQITRVRKLNEQMRSVSNPARDDGTLDAIEAVCEAAEVLILLEEVVPDEGGTVKLHADLGGAWLAEATDLDPGFGPWSASVAAALRAALKEAEGS